MSNLPASSDAKRERFCREYVIDHNGKQAAIRSGYSRKTAESQASRLLRNAKVQARIRQLEQGVADRLVITKDRTMRGLAGVAFSDFRRLFNPDGSMKAPHDIDDDTAAAVSSVEVVEEFEGKGEKRKLVGYTRKVRLWPKVDAQRALLRHAAIALPALRGSLVQQGEAVTAALSEGKLSIEEGAQLMQIVGAQARIVEVDDLVKRVAALEQQMIESAHHA